MTKSPHGPMCRTPTPLEPVRSNETYQYKGEAFSLNDIEYSVCRECGFDLVLPHQTRRNEASVRDEHRRIDLLRRSKVEMLRVAHEVLVSEIDTSQRCEGRRDHSLTPLSDEGARRHRGRFNRRGLPALYTSPIPLVAI